MDQLLEIYSWCAAHPKETAEVVLFVWGIANVVWALWPRPHSDRGQKVWKWLHALLGLVATHTTAKGTFTWPSLVRTVVTGVLKVQAPDPFTEHPEKKSEIKTDSDSKKADVSDGKDV